MLNFLNHFTVPGVPHVMVYHDDKDPDRFHIISELPAILKNPAGKPSFSLISFARDFTLLADEASELPTAETEGGLLQFTSSLEVSQEDQKTIRQYISSGGPGTKVQPVYRGGRVVFNRRRRPHKVKLAYPTWVDGSVNFHLFPEGGSTFVKAIRGSEKPSLVASNLASFQAVLGQEGLRLLRNSLEEGWSPGTLGYGVSFVARIPTLSVTVKGKSSDVYEEIKKHSTITETYRNGNRTRTYRYPQVSSLEEMRDLFTGLHITFDRGDFRSGAEGGDATAAIEDLVFTVVQQLITQKFLAVGFEPGLNVEKLGTDPLAHSGGDQTLGGNQLWLKNFDQSMEAEIDFTFSGSTNLTVERNPTAGLFTLMDKQDIKDSIIEADLSQPYFSLLDVPVHVTADFDRDPIAAIKVFLDYDQIDEKASPRQRKRKTEEFLFDSTDDRFFFRTVMARNADGTPKDTYSYRSQIIYKASARSVEIPAVDTRDRNLVIGYDQLNCVNVTCYWGAIPVEAVQQVQISFRYPGINSPSATADLLLRPDAPQGSWFTYTGDLTSKQYEYDVTFFMNDGQLINLPTQRSASAQLIINAPFQDKLSATFVPQGTFPPISRMVVTTEYEDGEYQAGDVHSFLTGEELWTWEIDLRDRSKRAFRYRVDISYVDGASDSSEWLPGEEGTILIGDVAREMLEVEVVPDLIDMTQWKLVLVRLAYDDPANGVDAQHTVKLTAASPSPGSLLWTVPIKDATKKSFSYEIQAFGHNGERHTAESITTDDPLLLLDF